MAKAIRIDGVTFAGDSVQVAVTSGQTPLPQSASGSVLAFANRQALTDAVEAFQSSLNDESLAFFALANWMKADPNMLLASSATGRTAQLDLLGASAAVKVT